MCSGLIKRNYPQISRIERIGKGILKRFLSQYLDDILLLAGCACILYGLSIWSAAVTWITGGAMLVGLAYLVGRVKARDVID